MSENTQDIVKSVLKELLASDDKDIKALVDRVHDSQEEKKDKKSDYAEMILKGFNPNMGMTPAQEQKAQLKRIGGVIKMAAMADKNPLQAEKFMKALGNEVLTKDMGEVTFAGGAVLVSQVVSDMVIELLRGTNVLYKMGALEVPMPSGNMSFPKLTTGATAAYIGENVAGTSNDLALGSVNLLARKLMALVTVSNELLYDTSGKAETIFTNDMIAALSNKMDITGFRGDGAVNTPKGIYNLVNASQLIAANSSGSTTADKIKIDLKELIVAVVGNNIPMTRPGFVMASRPYEEIYTATATTGQYIYRDEMNRGILSRYPIAQSNNIPTNLSGSNTEIYFGDFAQLLIGTTGGLELDFSKDINFKADQTVFKAVMRHDFGLRHDKAFAVKTGIAY